MKDNSKLIFRRTHSRKLTDLLYYIINPGHISPFNPTVEQSLPLIGSPTPGE
jgi:hypothetical protein